MTKYDDMYDNMYNPRLEVITFIFIKETIKTDYTKGLQKSNSNIDNSLILTKINPQSISNAESFPFPSVIRNVTPRNKLFRRKYDKIQN